MPAAGCQLERQDGSVSFTTLGSVRNNISLCNDSNVQWNPHIVIIQDALTPNVPMMLTAVPYFRVHAKSASPISFGRNNSGKLPDYNPCYVN